MVKDNSGLTSADYYDFQPLMSRNATFNFIAGARGVGKTYGAKNMGIRNWIKTGEQFIVLRRYRSEIKTTKTFFADIAHTFPEYEFSVNGSEGQARVKGSKAWETICYFIALSTSGNQKSVAYPNVTLIIFDEFIINKGAVRYLPGEAQMFIEFYSTVDRWKDKTKVLFLANSVSINNPYFIEYGIRPDGREFQRYFKGFIAVHFVNSDEFAGKVLKTKFGSFLQSVTPDYIDYAVYNDFVDNNQNYIGAKCSEAGYYCTIHTKKGYFSVWLALPFVYVQAKRPKGNERMICTDVSVLAPGEPYFPYSDKRLQMIRTAYNKGKMFFDSPMTRELFLDLFKR